MHNDTLTREAVAGTARAILAFTAIAGLAGSAAASDRTWSIELQPIFMEAHGHDQHVLTVHEIDLDSTPTLDSKSAVTIDTDSGPAYRGEIRATGEKWGWGIDFLWFNTSQELPRRTAAAGGGSHRVVFEVADRELVSSDPSEVLFYERLEDTDLALWTVDLYALRTLAEGEASDLHLLFGLRNGDFDNDYRAVVGVEGMGGVRLDASSNYGRMMGPMLALAGEARLGRNTFEGHLGQSLLLGTAELRSSTRDFSGPYGDTPSFVAEETFGTELDVAIPVSELRLAWRYALSSRVELGLGVEASTWWDVSVPPGVIPTEGGNQVLHENTLVLFGLSAGVKLTF